MGSDTVAACAALHLGKKGTWCTFQNLAFLKPRFGLHLIHKLLGSRLTVPKYQATSTLAT